MPNNELLIPDDTPVSVDVFPRFWRTQINVPSAYVPFELYVCGRGAIFEQQVKHPIGPKLVIDRRSVGRMRSPHAVELAFRRAAIITLVAVDQRTEQDQRENDADDYEPPL